MGVGVRFLPEEEMTFLVGESSRGDEEMEAKQKRGENNIHDRDVYCLEDTNVFLCLSYHDYCFYYLKQYLVPLIEDLCSSDAYRLPYWGGTIPWALRFLVVRET